MARARLVRADALRVLQPPRRADGVPARALRRARRAAVEATAVRDLAAHRLHRSSDPDRARQGALAGRRSRLVLGRLAQRALEQRAERHPVRPRGGGGAGRVARLGARDERLVLGDRAAARQAARSGARAGAAAASAGRACARPGLPAARRRPRGSARRRRRPRRRRGRAAPDEVVVGGVSDCRSSLGQARNAELGRQPVHRREERERPRGRRGASSGATRVKRCGAISTSPSSRSRRSASRTGVRLSPSQPHSSSSCSGSPGASVPSTIASQQLVVGGVPQQVPVDGVPPVRNWHFRCPVDHAGQSLASTGIADVGLPASRISRRGDGSAAMCLAIPGRILEVVDEANRLAKVDVAGVQRTVNIGLLDATARRPGRRLGPDPRRLRALEGRRGGGARRRSRCCRAWASDFEAELEELKASVIE